jgi:hypothetical protein
MENMKDIHVWLGVYGGGDEAWEKYFDVEKYGSGCGFCRDTHTEWFDLDRFSAYDAGAAVPVEDIVIEVPYSEQFESELLRACRALGISRATHCFTMIDFGGTVTVGSEYCGLTSVGVFPFSA